MGKRDGHFSYNQIKGCDAFLKRFFVLARVRVRVRMGRF